MKKVICMLSAVMLLLTACGGGKEEASTTIDLQEFCNTVATACEWDLNYMTRIEDEMLESYYPGLKALAPKQLVTQMAMMSAVVNEVAFVECQTEEDATKAAEILQDRIDYQVGDENNRPGAMYPESVESWKKAKVIQHGTYVAMIASADSQEKIESSFNELFT